MEAIGFFAPGHWACVLVEMLRVLWYQPFAVLVVEEGSFVV